MRDRADTLEREMLAEIERVKRSFRAEIVPYGAYDAGEIVPGTDAKPVKIPVERPARRPQREARSLSSGRPNRPGARDSSPGSRGGGPGGKRREEQALHGRRRPGDDEVVADLPEGEHRLQQGRSPRLVSLPSAASPKKVAKKVSTDFNPGRYSLIIWSSSAPPFLKMWETPTGTVTASPGFAGRSSPSIRKIGEP